jgi:transposase
MLLVEGALGDLRLSQIGRCSGDRCHMSTLIAAGRETVENRPRPATQASHIELGAMADEHSALRVWAIEGTGGYGAGLARHQTDHGEVVIELDRPKRQAAPLRSQPRQA